MASAPRPLTPLVLLDGGLGTTLSLPPYNITFDKTTPLWSSHLLLSPTSLSTLSSIQTSFADAGAEVLLTDTYQASYEGFSRTPGWEGGEKEVGKAMRGAVSVGRDAFGGKKGTVALSLGPYGATMIPGQEYSGKYDEGHREVDQLKEWHLKRLQAFASSEEVDEAEKVQREQSWSDIDLIAFETVPLLKEVQAVRQVMGYLSNAQSSQKPFWIVCVFPGEGNSLPDGTSVKELVKVMLEKRAGEAVPMGIGLNCTKITKVEGLIKEFEEAVTEMVAAGQVSEWPSLVVYPDGTDGEVYNTTTMTWEKKERGNEVSLFSLSCNTSLDFCTGTSLCHEYNHPSNSIRVDQIMPFCESISTIAHMFT